MFHSIRKTVVTLLEDAGVSENLTADIMGHEKPRITYGLYSGGHSLTSMKEAIEKIHCPFGVLAERVEATSSRCIRAQAKYLGYQSGSLT